MRVLIADEFEQSGRDALHAMGYEVDFAPKLKDETLVAEVAQFRPDVLVVRSTKVSEAVLAAGALKPGLPAEARIAAAPAGQRP